MERLVVTAANKPFFSSVVMCLWTVASEVSFHALPDFLEPARSQFGSKVTVSSTLSVLG